VTTPGKSHDEKPCFKLFTSEHIDDTGTGAEVNLYTVTGHVIEHDGGFRRFVFLEFFQKSSHSRITAVKAVFVLESPMNDCSGYSLVVPIFYFLGKGTERGCLLLCSRWGKDLGKFLIIREW
jgi:hypothetical protein